MYVMPAYKMTYKEDMMIWVASYALIFGIQKKNLRDKCKDSRPIIHDFFNSKSNHYSLFV